MNLPDQSHINHVRDLLWQRRGSGASVMIGAGFSRNADPIGASVREFPLWHQIAKKLCTKLYSPNEGDRLKDALIEASSTSGFLRLAQEYEVAFGRGSLHQFIKENVPDTDYLPSEFHIELLELPWKDVLTTNWDTLLERTRLAIPDKSYSVVRTIEEIASAKSPRIIKLHGTLPANSPYIFTEEDYRTYPKKFAPFVNTVQQVMMESVVLLIGFSGDDPNFLQWSGWVRDNLGESSPKIYLAGWLNLSPHRRRMLEDRNVVPIDIANHPQASKWPDHLRHKYATEWIIKTLQEGQSYNFKNWPEVPNNNVYSYPHYLNPIEKNDQKLPMSDSRLGIHEPINPDKIRSIIETWAHNRTIYPNWLLFPLNRLFYLERSINEWEPEILRCLNDLTVVERLKALREIVWRYQILLTPISNELDEAATNLLGQINFQTKSSNAFDLVNSDWNEFRDCFIEITLALLTAARFSLDEIKFNKILQQLAPFQDNYVELKHALIHEKCLWFLYSLDLSMLDLLLNEWDVTRCDPIWMFRKAALLIELNLEEEAKKITIEGLTILRSTPDQPNNFANASREGWALLLVRAFKYGINLEDNKNEDSSINVWDRWEQLGLVNCDAKTQKNDLLNKIENSSKDDNTNTPFDLYIERGRTIHFNNFKYQTFVNTYRSFRLCEVAALPLAANNVVVASDIVKATLKNWGMLNIDFALRMVIRLKPPEDDKIINSIYSRTNIAVLPLLDVSKLYEQIHKLLIYSISKLDTDSDRFWLSYIRTSIEALSRLVLRFDGAMLIKAFNLACDLYKNNRLNKEIWLGASIGNLLTRCYEATPNTFKGQFSLDLLMLPIVGLNDFVTSDRFIDAGDIFNNNYANLVIDRLPENNQIWRNINQNIIAGLEAGGKSRKNAAIRLNAISPYLNSDESDRIARALWQDNFLKDGMLPSGTSLYDFSFLSLPEPNQGLAELNFRLKYLSGNTDVSDDYNALCRNFKEISYAIIKSTKLNSTFTLSEMDQQNLTLKITTWLDRPRLNILEGNELSRMFHQGDQDPSRIISTLKDILPRLPVSEELAFKILEKMEYLHSVKLYNYALLGSLVKFLPQQTPRINIFLRKGLISETQENASYAMYGLYIWLETALKISHLKIPTPSNDLIFEVGLAVATRRTSCLIQALIAANAIFEYGTRSETEIIDSLIIEGLKYLKIEQVYKLDHPNPQQVPLVRLRCAILALTMFNNGYHDVDIVNEWIEISKTDTLPEVRCANQYE